MAIALRNRARRTHIEPEMAEEIEPKNILMVGPTGVGKTEIARRLARFSGSPFVKVEASKFTEVGYVGRDVESMVRDLVEVSVEILRDELMEEVQEQAELNAEERLLDLLLPTTPTPGPPAGEDSAPDEAAADTDAEAPADENGPGEEEEEGAPDDGDGGPGFTAEEARRARRTREKLRARLRAGGLAERTVEVEIKEPQPPFLEALLSGPGDDLDVNTSEMLRQAFGPRYRKTEMVVAQALDYLMHEEEERLVDRRHLSRLAMERAEDHGIIFIDELDKVASKRDSHGPEVSRAGVQRDLLPLLDGSTVTTRHGSLRTDHILFIGAGAFLDYSPADLIPELQGRFPIRTELHELTVDDFERILTEPQSALVKQYAALLATDGVSIRFEQQGVREVAEVAAAMNDRMEDIGARRLHTILEKVLEDLLFEAPDIEEKEWTIDREFVRNKLADVLEEEDVSRFIL